MVRFGYQHFIILGPGSRAAAEASECAAEQGAFWDYHDFLYDPQARGNRGFDEDSLKQFAAELGLDSSAFNTCLDSGTSAAVVQSETTMIRSLGARGTPAFLVNGQPLAGAQPFDVFEGIIKAEIEASEG